MRINMHNRRNIFAYYGVKYASVCSNFSTFAARKEIICKNGTTRRLVCKPFA